jgi:hypothetical protein
MRKDCKIIRDGGDSGSKKCKPGYDLPVMGLWALGETVFGMSLEYGARRSISCSFVWQESGFSPLEDVFTLNLLYKEVL